ncbi:TetR/AcrR family transcriptional regulator [Thermoleophilia bacterium SCSIO 60948]|nr:TetR/AcrR family transcriptional regulator [Thermoleophilia bacterium SCSIO 60948]
MPAATVTSHERWVEAGFEGLVAGGPDAVRVEPLATRLGVTKGGFYGRFGSRDAFLATLLDEWERRSVDDVVALVESEGGEAGERIRRAGALTFSDELLPIDLAVRAWARTDPGVAGRLHGVDEQRLGYLRSQFATLYADPDEVEARSTLAFAAVIGEHFITAGHGERSRAEVLGLVTELIVGA